MFALYPPVDGGDKRFRFLEWAHFTPDSGCITCEGYSYRVGHSGFGNKRNVRHSERLAHWLVCSTPASRISCNSVAKHNGAAIGGLQRIN